MKSKGNIYLTYPKGSHPAHRYQAKALNAILVPYAKVIPWYFKETNISASEGFRPLIAASMLRPLRLSKYHVNILLGDFMQGKTTPSLRRLINAVYDGCDAIIANSSLTADFFKRDYGKKHAHKVEVCWPLSNTKLFGQIDSYLLNKKPPDKNQRLNICYLGHLNYLRWCRPASQNIP